MSLILNCLHVDAFTSHTAASVAGVTSVVLRRDACRRIKSRIMFGGVGGFRLNERNNKNRQSTSTYSRALCPTPDVTTSDRPSGRLANITVYSLLLLSGVFATSVFQFVIYGERLKLNHTWCVFFIACRW